MGLKSKNAKKGDPLSRYFKDLNESDMDSDEESESDGDNTTTEAATTKSVQLQIQNNKDETEKESPNPPDDQRNNSSRPFTQKLPSARDCLQSKIKNPTVNLTQKKEINWDHSTNLKCFDDNESSQALDYKSNAVPPPTSYEPVTDSSTKVVDSEGRKRKSAADELEEQKISSKTCRLGGATTQHTAAPDA